MKWSVRRSVQQLVLVSELGSAVMLVEMSVDSWAGESEAVLEVMATLWVEAK